MRHFIQLICVFVALPAYAQQFTTAGEVRPILTATRANWIALRQYEGQDLLYFTQLESWRCGLSDVRFSINGGAAQTWPLEECYENTAAPNAIKGKNGLPYTAMALDSVNEVSVTITYDDGSRDSSTYSRSAILMP